MAILFKSEGLGRKWGYRQGMPSVELGIKSLYYYARAHLWKQSLWAGLGGRIKWLSCYYKYYLGEQRHAAHFYFGMREWQVFLETGGGSVGRLDKLYLNFKSFSFLNLWLIWGSGEEEGRKALLFSSLETLLRLLHCFSMYKLSPFLQWPLQSGIVLFCYSSLIMAYCRLRLCST
jgi:hypothetical protein